MDDVKMVNAQNVQPKKRRSRKEIEEERNKAIEKLNADAEAGKLSIANLEEQKARLEEEIKKAKETLTKNRNTIRTHHAMVMYGDLINIFGFAAKEKSCCTDSDYEELRNLITEKANHLMSLDTKHSKR